MLPHRHLGLPASAFLWAVLSPPAALPGQAPVRDEERLSDSVAYALDSSSVLLVHAGKAGLLKGLGHEHQVRAHAFAGAVVYFPGDIGRSRVRVTVLTDSLRVVPEADSADIPEITRTMREKTLRVDSFPEIVFESRLIEGIEGVEGIESARGTGGAGSAGSTGRGSSIRRIRVNGDLTMAGVTRPVSVHLSLDVTADTLRAEGSFVVKQTDFGIKPYSTALGFVKVKNEVQFELRVVATAVLAGR